MVEFLAERAERSEDWYTSESKEKVLCLKARRYLEAPSAPPVHRKIRYRHVGFLAKGVTCEPERNRRKVLDRRQYPPEETARQEIPRGLILAVQRMIELLELPPGWNSYNARPIRKENVNFALGFLGQTMLADTPVPNVIPMVRGGVQLEWHTRGINLEVSIYSPGEISFLAEDVRSGDNPVEGESDLAALRQWVERLSR
jgi:hypothetical protein